MTTWKLSNGRLLETSDELEALQTSINNILSTACGDYEIFSWNYGNQLLNILAEDNIEEKIEDYICSCLLYDDRILTVEDLTFTKDFDQLNISFTVVTDFGTLVNEVIF